MSLIVSESANTTAWCSSRSSLESVRPFRSFSQTILDAMPSAAEATAQFEDGTAYETLVLTSLAHARELEMGGATEVRDDIRGTSKAYVRGMSEHLGGSTARAAVEPFRGLVFAAAYKVLDLAVELTMVLNKTPQPGWRWTFVQKQKYARSTPAPKKLPAPLDSAPALWGRFTVLYDRFLEPRHAVVHNRIEQDASGNIQPYDPQGRPITAIGADDVEAFALAVHELREAIVSGTSDQRRLNAASWHLDALRHIHGLAPLGAEQPAAVARLIVDNLDPVEAGRWRINVKKIAEHITAQDGVRFADLELHSDGDGRGAIFTARFENLPAGQDAIEFDESTLPPWLSRAS